jgi:hypothetical protein
MAGSPPSIPRSTDVFEDETAHAVDDEHEASNPLAVAAGNIADEVTNELKNFLGHMKGIKKFSDINFFNSTADADRQELLLDQEQRGHYFGLLHPDTGATTAYNQMHLILVLYLLAILPVRAAFGIVPRPDEFQFWADVFIDLTIVLDIMLNFKKYYMAYNVLVTRPATIAERYMRGWFFLDVMSVLPVNYVILLFDSIPSSAGNTGKVFRMARIVRFARLIKLSKLTRLKDAMTVIRVFLNNVGISAMDFEFMMRIGGLVRRIYWLSAAGGGKRMRHATYTCLAPRY